MTPNDTKFLDDVQVPEDNAMVPEVPTNMPDKSVPETGMPEEVGSGSVVPDSSVPEDRVPDTTEDLPSMNMPPPASQIPKVKLLPPTPNMSQEAATSLPMMLWVVPQSLTTSDIQPGNAGRSCSRSCSLVLDPSQLCHSPQLGSPMLGMKRLPSDTLDEPDSKRPKGD